MAFVFNDPDFNLPLPNAQCLHDSLHLIVAEAMQHDVCCSAASVTIKRVSQSEITSYSTASPRSILSMARSAATSRSVVMRQSGLSLLVKASETG